MLEVMDGNQRMRLAEAAAAVGVGRASPEAPSSRDSELAYLTHEGMFISDAFSEPDQQLGGATPGPDSASGTTESSSSREQVTPPLVRASGAVYVPPCSSLGLNQPSVTWGHH